MAETVYSGGYAVYWTSAALTSSQIVTFSTGSIPPTSAWTRIFTSADDGASLKRKGETLQLKSQENGTLKNVIISPDEWSFDFPVVDITADNARKFMFLDSNAYSSSGTLINFAQSYVGVDLYSSNASRCYLIVHSEYVTSTDVNVPPLTDPNAFCFAAGGILDREEEISYDPKTQQMYNVSLGFKTVSTTSDVKAFGMHGTVTTTS